MNKEVQRKIDLFAALDHQNTMVINSPSSKGSPLEYFLNNYLAFNTSPAKLNDEEIKLLIEDSDVSYRMLYDFLRDDNLLNNIPYRVWSRLLEKQKNIFFTILLGGENLRLKEKAIDILIDNTDLGLTTGKDGGVSVAVAAMWQADEKNVKFTQEQLFRIIKGSNLRVTAQGYTALGVALFYAAPNSLPLTPEMIIYLIDHSMPEKSVDDGGKSSLYVALKNLELYSRNSLLTKEWLPQLFDRLIFDPNYNGNFNSKNNPAINKERKTTNGLFNLLETPDLGYYFKTKESFNNFWSGVINRSDLVIKNVNFVDPRLSPEKAITLFIKNKIDLSPKSWDYLIKNSDLTRDEKKYFFNEIRKNYSVKGSSHLIEIVLKENSGLIQHSLNTFASAVKYFKSVFIKKPSKPSPPPNQKPLTFLDNMLVSIQSLDIDYELRDQAVAVVKDFKYWENIEHTENKSLFLKFYPEKILSLLKNYDSLEETDKKSVALSAVKESLDFMHKEHSDNKSSFEMGVKLVALRNINLINQTVKEVASRSASNKTS